ncbi:MAG: aminotransferase class I/II-fold pyridoxal phosphate-dependent enzyme [Polyangiaceae bacterium]|jgi:7-keto-8-aminopelargonate synthetase-like enzyme|nr:aminotransferase class I/II-fold pyridoxal phosphate-dependent enzyme [Polyangiaceae bacterium]MBK8942186.1 aminotransferase class I/II-fold pyridoxal phosphate-dependent enzyme [Polyangiaceae bacterium]
MDLALATRLSLADFHGPETDDPLAPPPDYLEWRAATTWATGLYEKSLLGPPTPRTELDVGGQRRKILNFASYNYLGLAKHPATIAAAKRALDDYGTGACGSPILSGMTDLHRELEASLSRFLGRESTMLFNSGFGGGLGSLQGVLRKGDVAIVDQKVHMCLLDGVKLSGASLVAFEHNDPASLDAALTKASGKRRLVIVEGIYSMDGDTADLPQLLPIAEQHGVQVFIDEAHSILAIGPKGRGVAAHYGMHDRVAVQYATFSKSFAGVGGFVSTRKETLDYVRYYANPYGFSCALPPAVVASVLAGLDVATRDESLRTQLADNADYFRAQLRGLGLDVGRSTTHVVPIVIGDNRELLYGLQYAMLSRGLFLAPVDFPSVPMDEVRFRASVTAAHTRADLDEALDIIARTVVPALRRAA